MALRNSKAILAKGIELDRDYKNILDYSESSMINLVTSKQVAYFNNCSFIRNENAIDLEVAYGTALQADYLAFQNPNYSNKWFFAFIDKVEYKGERNTRIYYTVDVCSTWFDYWTAQKCWVIREHANTDNPGDNLVPENLEMGEFVNNGSRINISGTDYCAFALISTAAPADSTKYVYNNLGGVLASGRLFCFTQAAQFGNFVLKLSNEGKLDAISQAYLIPYAAIGGNLHLNSDFEPFGDTDEELYYRYKGKNEPYTRDTNISRPSSLNGYTPVNKKLLTAPFMSLVVSNSAGTVSNYAYEFFSDPSTCKFTCEYAPVVGCSFVAIPRNYKGIDKNMNELIVGPKFPALQWTGDVYTNWLTQNAVNIGIGIVSDGIGLVKSAASGDPNNLVNTIESTGFDIANKMAEFYKHSLVPMSIRGSSNVGDVMSAAKELCIYGYPMSITSQFAERIDQYFTRYGYATNKLKIPNQTGRSTFNYVQIAAGEDIGYPSANFSVPPADMEIINNAYRAGVTIWHNHDNIGKFDLANGII